MQKSEDTGYWLAVDPGGTKCAALLVGPDGTALAQSEQRSLGESGRNPELVWRAVAGVLTSCPPGGLRVGLIGSPSYNTLLHTRLDERGFPVVELIGLSESEAALALANEPYGIVAVAGTGSFVAAHAPDGRYFRLDGLGPMLGDTGSAFHIGWMAARAAALAAQHPHFTTTLLPRVYEALHVVSLDELIHLSLRPLDRSVIASLARVADGEARKGDRIAGDILATAADALAQHVAEVAEIFALAADAPCTLVGIGSVLQRSTIYWERFRGSVLRLRPLLTPHRVSQPAVLGVALAALAKSAAHPDPALLDAQRQRLRDSYDRLPEDPVPPSGDRCHA